MYFELFLNQINSRLCVDNTRENVAIGGISPLSKTLVSMKLLTLGSWVVNSRAI